MHQQPYYWPTFPGIFQPKHQTDYHSKSGIILCIGPANERWYYIVLSPLFGCAHTQNAWRHQAITWTNVDLSSVGSSDIHLRASSQEIPQPSMTEIIWKIKYLKFHLNFPGANELRLGWAWKACLYCDFMTWEQFLNYWSWRPVASPHKSPVMQQGLSCHDFFMSMWSSQTC